MPEMMWRSDPNVDAARKTPGWGAFHKAAGQTQLYFDVMVKAGRGYTCDAFTLVDLVPTLLVTGRGSTVIEAVADGYRQSGRMSPAADAALALMSHDDFDDLLADEFEELMG